MLLSSFSPSKRNNRKRRPAGQNSENNGLRISPRGVQDNADVPSGHIRMDGARSDQELHLLEGERRVELRGAPLGVVDGRDSLQGYRHTGRCIRRRGQQTHVTHSEHVSAAVAGSYGK